MSEKVRPPEIKKKLYNEFKKYCIDEDLKTGKALEEAIEQFMKEDDTDGI